MPSIDRRLIEDWLPINEISVEAIREAVPFALPAASGEADSRTRRAAIDRTLNEIPVEESGVDLDAYSSEIVAQPSRAAREGGPHWRVTTPAGNAFSVTVDRSAYEKGSGRVEWFGPGSPAFPPLHP